MQAVMVRQAQPDIAQTVYSQLGMDPTWVRLAGVRESVSKLNPGDLVAWHGGDRPDGTYAGQMAVYAGEGQIIEDFFGRPRRRALRREDNVYGLPVHMQEQDDNSNAALSGPVPGPPEGPGDGPGPGQGPASGQAGPGSEAR